MHNDFDPDGDDWFGFIITLICFALIAGMIAVFLIACGHDIPEIPEATPTVAPSATPVRAQCTGIQAIDDGFLWKPKSDPDGATPNKLVILFPSHLSSKFSSVHVAMDSGRYTGKSNGDRQTWRFPSEGCFYGKDALVEAVNGDDSVCTWLIPDGCRRWE